MKETCVIIICAVAAVILFTGGVAVGYSIAETDKVSIDYPAVHPEISYKDEPVYVIGHKNPDTDAVCSAIVYANLLQKLGINAEARIAGPINEETRFVLGHFGVNEPAVLGNASWKSIIMVDHSSYSQAVDGVDTANIVEIIDHHSASGVVTSAPVYYRGLPVGATATVVWVSYLESGIEMSESDAGLLASAILSDTDNLRLSTTTVLDRQALEYLTKIAGIDDVDGHYQKMLNAASSYTGLSDKEIFYSDYKEYNMSGNKVGVAVVNAVGKEKTEEMSERMTYIMKQISVGKSPDNFYVIIIDRKNDTSKLISYGSGTKEIVRDAFGTDEGGTVTFPAVVSRKKDIIPALMETYKKRRSANAVSG